MADVKDPQKLVDDIAKQENEEDRAAVNKYVVEPAKKLGKRLYENVMGTEEQNKAAQERMDKAKAVKKAKGGVIKRHEYSAPSKSSASKRADGCAIRGKTRA